MEQDARTLPWPLDDRSDSESKRHHHECKPKPRPARDHKPEQERRREREQSCGGQAEERLAILSPKHYRSFATAVTQPIAATIGNAVSELKSMCRTMLLPSGVK